MPNVVFGGALVGLEPHVVEVLEGTRGRGREGDAIRVSAGLGQGVGHAEAVAAGPASLHLNLQGVVLRAAGVHEHEHGGDEGGILAHDAAGPGGVHAHAGVEVAGHELVAAEGVHVVQARGEAWAHRALEADRELVGVGDPPIGVVQGHGARVAHARAGREALGQQGAVDGGPVTQEGVGGIFASGRARVGGIGGEARDERARIHPGGDDGRNDLEVRLVEEAAVAPADHRPAIPLGIEREPQARGQVVAVDRIVRGVREARVVLLG